MSADAFADALPFTLSWEGGYVNHPADRGGATNRGITQAVYDDWRRAQGLAPADVRDLSEDELRAIYRDRYWTPSACPQLDTPLDQVQFDTAVNMGPRRAVRFLQQAVGATVDGSFGDGTLRCVRGCDAAEALQNYLSARRAFYEAIVARDASQQVFLKGWMNRLTALARHVGLPGAESAADEVVDFGDAGYMGRVPDLDEGDAHAR